MPPLHSVAIFWDYENCCPPATANGSDLVHRIRRMAHVFGGVTTFKAYTGVSDTCSSKTSKIRSELQSAGVSLIDCPHNNRKDVVDKMILVDMLAFAIDNPPEDATIVLIAGDKDYAYAVSVLRLRQYRVVLIVPPITSPSLRMQASITIDWDVAVLAKRTPALLDDPPVRQPYMDEDRERVSVLDNLARNFAGDPNAALPASHPVEPATPSSKSRRLSARELMRPCFGTVPSAPTEKLTNFSYDDDDTPERPSLHPSVTEPTSQPSRHRSISQPSQPLGIHPGVAINPHLLTPNSEALQRGYPSPIRIQPEASKTSSVPHDGSQVFRGAVSDYSAPAVANSVNRVSVNSHQFSLSLDSGKSDKAGGANADGPSAGRWSQPPPDASLLRDRAAADQQKDAGDQQSSAATKAETATPSSARCATPSARGTTQFSSNSSQSDVSIKATEPGLPSDTTPFLQTSVLADGKASDKTVIEESGNSALMSLGSASAQPTPAPATFEPVRVQVAPVTTNTSQFKILLCHLRIKLHERKVRVSRSFLAECMAMHRSALGPASGVPDMEFGAYVEMAARAGVVELGGEGVDAWVSLHPSQMTDGDWELVVAAAAAGAGTAKASGANHATSTLGAKAAGGAIKLQQVMPGKEAASAKDASAVNPSAALSPPSTVKHPPAANAPPATNLFLAVNTSPTADTAPAANTTPTANSTSAANPTPAVNSPASKSAPAASSPPATNSLLTTNFLPPGSSSLAANPLPANPSTANPPPVANPSPATGHSNASPCKAEDQVPKMLFPLYDVLMRALEAGLVEPARTEIAVQLMKLYPRAYIDAGVTKFKTYVAMAEKEGLVVLSTRNGCPMMSLCPQWRGLSTDRNRAPTPAASSPSSQVVASSSPPQRSASSASTNSPVSTISSLSSNLSHSSSDDWSVSATPSPFRPLILHLKSLRASGEWQPLRSKVGSMMNSTIYNRAGVAGFKEYINLAEAASVVQIGGSNGSEWLMLHPSKT